MKHVLLLLAFAGCAAPPAAPPPPVPPAPKLILVEAQDTEFERIVRELLDRGRTVEEQQRIYASQRHYELALACFNKSDFEKAKVECQKSIQHWHENLAARKLLHDVNSILVGGTSHLTPAEWEVRTRHIGVEQGQIEITKHVRDGERYANAKMFDEALKEFENAEFKILHLPNDVKAMNDLLPLVREQKLRAQRQGQEAVRARERELLRKVSENAPRSR